MTFKIFGFELVDILHTPLNRRLQTLACFQWAITFFFSGFVGVIIFFACLWSTYLRPLSIIYLIWIIYDIKTPEQGGRRFEFARGNVIWKYLRDYFPVGLIKTAELSPESNYLFLYHPHGIMGCGAFLNFATEATGFSKIFPGLKAYLITLKMHFFFPFFREYVLSLGICSCSYTSIYNLLAIGKGNAVGLVVGGAYEALESNPGNSNIAIKKRKGFIKLALQTGASLVPMYGFGENDLFVQYQAQPASIFGKFQRIATKVLSFSPALFHGRGIFNYTFGIIPFRRPVHVVVGKPLELGKTENPSLEEIDAAHQRYMNHLVEHFEEHKLKYGIPAEQHLNFI